MERCAALASVRAAMDQGLAKVNEISSASDFFAHQQFRHACMCLFERGEDLRYSRIQVRMTNQYLVRICQIDPVAGVRYPPDRGRFERACYGAANQ